MALIPASAQVTSISIFNIIIAYFLLVNPEKLSTYTFTTLMSLAFNLPYKPPSFAEPSAISAVFAVVLAYVSINDIVAATNVPGEIFYYHWGAQAPVRAMFFFVVTIFSFLTGPEGVGKVAKVLAGGSGMMVPSGPGKLEGGLTSGVVFVYGFVMVMWWFWIYVTVADEKREMMMKARAKRA